MATCVDVRRILSGPSICSLPRIIQLVHTPAILAAVTKVKLARKAQTDERVEVDVDECRWRSDMEVLRLSTTNSTSSREPCFAFRMAQELAFLTLAHPGSGTRLLDRAPLSVRSTMHVLVPLLLV